MMKIFRERTETVKCFILKDYTEGWWFRQTADSGALWLERETAGLGEKKGLLSPATSTVHFNSNKAQGREAKTKASPYCGGKNSSTTTEVGASVSIPGFHLDRLEVCTFEEEPSVEEPLHCGVAVKTQLLVTELSRPALTHYVRIR